jgi:hypothetical protein
MTSAFEGGNVIDLSCRDCLCMSSRLGTPKVPPKSVALPRDRHRTGARDRREGDTNGPAEHPVGRKKVATARVSVNGMPLGGDVIVRNGVAYVPLRATKALNCTVSWDRVRVLGPVGPSWAGPELAPADSIPYALGPVGSDFGSRSRVRNADPLWLLRPDGQGVRDC